STVAVKPGRKVGVTTIPSVQESEVSGFRNGLPPVAAWHWLVGQLSAALNTEPAGTPVAMQSAAVVGTEQTAEQGSFAELADDPPAGVNSSDTFGARTARWKPPRKRMSSIGCHSIPRL